MIVPGVMFNVVPKIDGGDVCPSSDSLLLHIDDESLGESRTLGRSEGPDRPITIAIK